MEFVEITKSEAKRAYCRGGEIYISTVYRTYWPLPASHCYSIRAPAETLFERSIPSSEGKVHFFSEYNRRNF